MLGQEVKNQGTGVTPTRQQASPGLCPGPGFSTEASMQERPSWGLEVGPAGKQPGRTCMSPGALHR